MKFCTSDNDGSVTNFLVRKELLQTLSFIFKKKYMIIKWFNLHCRVRYPSEEKSAPEVIAKTVSPTSIAVDTVDNHVYWVQYGRLNGNIIRCNLNGSNETVILKNLHETFAITLDSKRRYFFLYFSDIHIYVIFLR
jgi:hypothetical protein